eukprot:tig00020961_g16768.t1
MSSSAVAACPSSKPEDYREAGDLERPPVVVPVPDDCAKWAVVPMREVDASEAGFEQLRTELGMPDAPVYNANLISTRKYRGEKIARAAHAAGDREDDCENSADSSDDEEAPLPPPWAGRAILMSLVYATDGTRLSDDGPGPMLEYVEEGGSHSRSNRASSVRISFNDKGHTQDTFGVMVSSHKHNKKPFALKVVWEDTQAPVARNFITFVTRTKHERAPRAPLRRPRVRQEGPAGDQDRDGEEREEREGAAGSDEGHAGGSGRSNSASAGPSLAPSPAPVPAAAANLGEPELAMHMAAGRAAAPSGSRSRLPPRAASRAARELLSRARSSSASDEGEEDVQLGSALRETRRRAGAPASKRRKALATPATGAPVPVRRERVERAGRGAPEGAPSDDDVSLSSGEDSRSDPERDREGSGAPPPARIRTAAAPGPASAPPPAAPKTSMASAESTSVGAAGARGAGAAVLALPVDPAMFPATFAASSSASAARTRPALPDLALPVDPPLVPYTYPAVGGTGAAAGVGPALAFLIQVADFRGPRLI